MEEKTLSNLYEEYQEKHNGKPKHSFAHFATVLSKLRHHRKYIRPKIIFWENVQNSK